MLTYPFIENLFQSTQVAPRDLGHQSRTTNIPDKVVIKIIIQTSFFVSITNKEFYNAALTTVILFKAEMEQLEVVQL